MRRRPLRRVARRPRRSVIRRSAHQVLLPLSTPSATPGKYFTMDDQRCTGHCPTSQVVSTVSTYSVVYYELRLSMAEDRRI